MEVSDVEVAATLLSLKVAFWSSLLTLPVAIFLAWMLARWRFPGKVLVDSLVHLPLVLPPVVVGYALGERIGPDGAQHHLEQVSVVPRAGGRGVGAALVEAVVGWAAAEGGRSLTLTTYGHLRWNASWYERLGFTVVPDDGLGPVLREVIDHEATLGLDPALRVAMRRPV